MIVRPTTEQLLLDCCKELMQGVLPALTDQTAIVRIFMIEQVLRNAAVRCSHEIEWMTEEIPVVEAYGRTVMRAAPRDDLASLLHRLEEAVNGRLDLDSVVERYVRAGEVLSTALEIAVTDGLADVVDDGEKLLEARLAREREVMAGWNPTGR